MRGSTNEHIEVFCSHFQVLYFTFPRPVGKYSYPSVQCLPPKMGIKAASLIGVKMSRMLPQMCQVGQTKHNKFATFFCNTSWYLNVYCVIDVVSNRKTIANQHSFIHLLLFSGKAKTEHFVCVCLTKVNSLNLASD